MFIPKQTEDHVTRRGRTVNHEKSLLFVQKACGNIKISTFTIAIGVTGV
jgi:hypothetical protein